MWSICGNWWRRGTRGKAGLFNFSICANHSCQKYPDGTLLLSMQNTNHFLNYTLKWQETPTSQLQSLPLILWISGPVKVSQQCPKDGTVLPRVETQQLWDKKKNKCNFFCFGPFLRMGNIANSRQLSGINSFTTIGHFIR